MRSHGFSRLLPLVELSGHETVADFGCGNGVLQELIGPRVREYVGVDFTEAFVRAARAAAGRIFGAVHGGLKPDGPMYLHTPNAE
jgi:predicted TPR repeat methyltransferase